MRLTYATVATLVSRASLLSVGAQPPPPAPPEARAEGRRCVWAHGTARTEPQFDRRLRSTRAGAARRALRLLPRLQRARRRAAAPTSRARRSCRATRTASSSASF